MELAPQFPISSESYNQPAYPPSSISASQTQLATISTSRSLDLNLVTEEGDKVTLSMDAQASALYLNSTSISMEGNGDFRYSRSELSAGSSQYDFSLTIEGDLSDEEQREIRKVIKILSKMMDQLAVGNTRPDVAAVNQLSGLDTIAGLDAHMSYERQVLVARQSETTALYDHTGELSDTPVMDMAPGVSSLSDKARANDMADELARYFRKAKAPWARKMEAVEQLFEDRLKSAGTEGDTHKNTHIFDYLHKRFLDALSDAGENFGQ